jgi:hypothetical protein
MNLLEIQDDLNKLLPLPQSIQYLTAAAQGGNPQVPPYMALARINEINKQMQSAQQTQPPAEPLNQSLPKQALQNMGIGALGQGQPMPQGAPQGAQPAPQMPPQQAPQQTPQQVMTAADGGLMSLPVDDGMFEYGSGGVVAFANPEGNQLVEDSDEDDEDVGEESDVGAGEDARVSYDAVAELRKLQPQIAAQMKQGVRPVRTRAEIEKALTKDYGVDTGPVGTKYLEGLASLKEAKAADRTQQDAEIAQREKMAAARALADWSEGSRGQKGLGGLNAFTRSYTTSAEKLMGERADLRQAGIKVDELLNEAKYKVQALRQAQRDGDIKAEQKADIDLAKIAKDLGVSKNTLIGRAVTGNLGVIGKQISADAQIQSARERAKGKGAGAAKKPTDLGTSFEVELAALLAAGEPDDAATRKKAMNTAQRNLSKSAGSERVDVSRIKEANDAFENRMILNRELNRIRKTDPAGYQAGVAKLKEEIKAEFGVKPTITDYDAPTRAPAPAQAPAAGAITPEAFQAKWATLKPGQKLVGPDGKTYTKG